MLPRKQIAIFLFSTFLFSACAPVLTNSYPTYDPFAPVNGTVVVPPPIQTGEIIVADTKFEFGTINGELLLIDECLTPDSSRFWPVDEYVVGQSPPSFDKQFVRDYLETLDWDKSPPAPRLPKDVIEKTSAKYREAFRRVTGSELANE